MLKGFRIPVRYLLIISPDGEVWQQTLMVYSVPTVHTKIGLKLFTFSFKSHEQGLERALVEELDYPIDTVTYVLDETYRTSEHREKLLTLLKAYGWEKCDYPLLP